MKHLLFGLLMVAFMPLLVADESDFDRSQKEAAEALSKAIVASTSIELVQIESSNFDKNGLKIDPATPNTIDGYKIIGKSTIHSKEEIAIISKSLTQSIMEAGLGDVAFCFNPQHALRFKVGSNDAVVVVCFHCAQGYAKNIADAGSFVLSDTARSDWDRIFKKHGMFKKS